MSFLFVLFEKQISEIENIRIDFGMFRSSSFVIQMAITCRITDLTTSVR